MRSKKTEPSTPVDDDVVRRLHARVESRKRDAAVFLGKITAYIGSEEWDLARGLCHTGAACFESLRDDTNRLSDLDG